jgi:hypothetical protein
LGISFRTVALGFVLRLSTRISTFEILLKATKHVLLQLLHAVDERLRLKDVPKVEEIMLTVEAVGQSWATKASREVGGTRGGSRGFVERR